MRIAGEDTGEEGRAGGVRAGGEERGEDRG